MKTGDVIIIDKVEDAESSGKLYKKVTDRAGNKFSIKSGPKEVLKEKWPLLQVGTAIKLTMGVFKDQKGNNWEFVRDFEVCEGVIPEPLQTGQTTKPGLILPYLREIEARARNTALMQSCELVKTDKIQRDELFSMADSFYVWLIGGSPVISKVTPKELKSVQEAIKEARTAPKTEAEPQPLQDIDFRGEVTMVDRKKLFANLQLLVSNKIWTVAYIKGMLLDYGGTGNLQSKTLDILVSLDEEKAEVLETNVDEALKRLDKSPEKV